MELKKYSDSKITVYVFLSLTVSLLVELNFLLWFLIQIAWHVWANLK
ncbi:MAG: hypothetical protein ACR2MD_01860 [Aridibacter sp.]